VERGEANMVLLAREMLRDPYWPLHAAAALKVETSWPVQYLRAAPQGSLARTAVSRQPEGSALHEEQAAMSNGAKSS
jgi:2,4-dienoyl-CoA reductase-like NADH-dependent reductase (Old Yellow Enzyme family)